MVYKVFKKIIKCSLQCKKKSQGIVMYSLPRYIPSLPTEKERCSLQGKSLQGTHGGGEDAGHREKGNVGQRAESPAPPPEGHVARGPGANRSS